MNSVSASRYLVQGLLLCAVTLASSTGYAQQMEQRRRDPFAQGRWRFGATAGYAAQFGGSNYVVLGGSANHFILPGLELGLDIEQWFGSPNITRLSPQTRYLFPLSTGWRPYLGVMYRHSFVSSNVDLDSVGARAGFVYVGGRSVFIGGGAIVERYFPCSKVSTCTLVYPEITLSIVL